MKTKQNNPTRIYITVSVEDRLPEQSGYYLSNKGKRHFSTDHKLWQHNYDDKSPVEWWLEEIKPSPTSSKEIANIVLTNAIYSLDKESARGLVRELCERFGLLPSEEEVKEAISNMPFEDNMSVNDFGVQGASFIINHIKGGQS